MREEDDIGAVYTKKDDIDRIMLKIKGFQYDVLKKNRHYTESLWVKDTDENELKKIYGEFQRIKQIFYRVRKNGFNSYDFHYELDNGTFATISVHLDSNPPEIINGFFNSTNFKNFMKAVSKRYWKKMI